MASCEQHTVAPRFRSVLTPVESRDPCEVLMNRTVLVACALLATAVANAEA
jgi:hypothetical protein